MLFVVNLLFYITFIFFMYCLLYLIFFFFFFFVFVFFFFFFFFSSRRRHTRCSRDWSSDVCSSDLALSFHVYVHGSDPCTYTWNDEAWSGEDCQSYPCTLSERNEWISHRANADRKSVV